MTPTGEIRKAIASRFCAPEWACFFEVQSGTGAINRRAADAVAMNLFPSRGLRLHMVEIKVSRGDFLREMKQPEKAEEIGRFCEHIWLAAPAKMVSVEELPPTWGLLELCGNSLRQKRAAPTLKPQPLDRAFIASLLRSAETLARSDMSKVVRSQTAKLEEERRKLLENSYTNQRKLEDYERLKKEVADFEEASGIKLTDTLNWTTTGKRLGAAVRIVDRLGLVDGRYGPLEQIASSAEQFSKGLAELKALGGVEVDEAAE